MCHILAPPGKYDEQLKTKECKTVIGVLSSLTKTAGDQNRQKVFFDSARVMARKKGLDFGKDIDLNPSWDVREIKNKHTGEVLGFQNQLTWAIEVPEKATA